MTTIVPLGSHHLPGVAAVIDACGLFPAEMLPGMMAGYLDGTATQERWFVVEAPVASGVAYAAPERMTDGCWNLLLIAVHPDRQGQGLGRALMTHAERVLAATGARLLLVETSGLPAFKQTRGFYRHLGYEHDATLHDYYQAGEDRLVFRKPLMG